MGSSFTWLLWLCVGALGLGATALAFAAWTTRPNRGTPWWLGGLLSGAAGLALVAGGAGTYWAWFPIHALVAVWPLLTLVGVRRFHARLPLWGTVNFDFAVLWTCLGALALAEVWIVAGMRREACAVAVTLLLHLYPATILLAAPEDEDRRLLRGMGFVWLVAALAPQAMAVGGLTVSAIWHASAAAMVPAALMTMVLCMVLLLQRHAYAGETRGSHPLSMFALTPQRPGRTDAFYEWIKHVLGAETKRGVVILIGARDRHLATTKGNAEFEATAMRLAHLSRDVIRTKDLAAQPESGTVALLLHDASHEQAVAITRRITSRWSGHADAKAWPAKNLIFGVTEAAAEDNLAEVWNRVKGALEEARRPGRAQVVTAWLDAGTVSYRRVFLADQKRAA
jgi:diguanylate cyclase